MGMLRRSPDRVGFKWGLLRLHPGSELEIVGASLHTIPNAPLHNPPYTSHIHIQHTRTTTPTLSMSRPNPSRPISGINALRQSSLSVWRLLCISSMVCPQSVGASRLHPHLSSSRQAVVASWLGCPLSKYQPPTARPPTPQLARVRCLCSWLSLHEDYQDLRPKEEIKWVMSEWIIALYAILSGLYLHTLKTKSFEKFFQGIRSRKINLSYNPNSWVVCIEYCFYSFHTYLFGLHVSWIFELYLVTLSY